jgi:hypothetical protein
MKQFLIAGALTCAGFAALLLAEVKVDYSHSADFAQYHTYSFIKVNAGNSLWTDRIQRDINEQLQTKGWTMTPSGGAVGITAWGSTKDEKTMNTFYDGLGGGWGWRGFGGDGMATTTVENTPVGTLVVDMFDNNSKKLIWRATAQNTLSDKPEKNEKKLENTIADMFRKFPPPSKG